MAKARGASLASIFDEEEAEAQPASVSASEQAESTPATRGRPGGRSELVPATRDRAKGQAAPSAQSELSALGAGSSVRRDSHPGKKGVLIHIPGDMHRVLRQLSVMEDGEPITKVVERSLAQYLAEKGYTRWVK